MRQHLITGFELALWAVWVGALWFLALLVAPALFKWLPRPDAVLVAGRLFYMMTCFSVGAVALLLLSSGLRRQWVNRNRASWALILVFVVGLVELAWLHPTINELSHAINASTDSSEVKTLRESFYQLHGIFSVLYAGKMVACLAWGLLVFSDRVRPVDRCWPAPS